MLNVLRQLYLSGFLLCFFICASAAVSSAATALPDAGSVKTAPDEIAVQPRIVLPPPRPVSPLPVSRLFRLEVPGAEQPVALSALSIITEIRGGFAETTLDMLFTNPNPRTLEGELQFPLLPGQTISGLALDVNGEMRAGVPVNKAKGQQIFEDTIRKRVDPALLEVTQGNSYKLRLYPIPANGTRRAQIRILEPLAPPAPGTSRLTYALPLDFAATLESFSLEVIVTSPAGQPTADAGDLGLTLAQVGTLYKGKVEKKTLSTKGTLTITLPASELTAETLTATRHNGKFYFNAALPIPLIVKPRNLPKTTTILWDASGSGENRNHTREFELLDNYFKAFNDGEARLVLIRNTTEEPAIFSIKSGNWDALKLTLSKVVYDGGTNLAAWKSTADCDEYLLFSDGLANFGTRENDEGFPALSAKQRVYSITASTKADYGFLRRISKGLPVIDLSALTAEQGTTLLLHEGSSLSIDSTPLIGKGKVLLAPESARPLPASGSASGDKEASDKTALCFLAGWINEESTDKAIPFTLNLTSPDGKNTPVTFTIVTKSDAALPFGDAAPLAARLWGQYKIAELEQNFERNKKAISRIGDELGIVSRETSLIVLETAEDYARYDVTPPPSLAAQVKQLQAQGLKKHDYEATLPVEHLLALWQQKVAWWNTTYPIVTKPMAKNPLPDAQQDYSEHSRTTTLSQRVETPARPQAAPASPPARTNEEASQTITLGSEARNEESQSGDFVARQRVRTTSGNIASEERKNTMGIDTTIDAAPPATLWARPFDSFTENTTLQQEMGTPRPTSAGIALTPWKSNAPYIARMEKAKDADLYAIYLDERPSYKNSSAFFLDAADRFFERKMNALGLRVLSNLVEMELENRQILRMLAYRLIQAKELRLAAGILERVKTLAPFEPQSYRDLALVLADLDEPQEAANLLYQVATRQWDSRFPDINTIALTELNALTATANTRVNTAAFDQRLSQNLASDLRVVLSWNADNTDMDLHVTDPNGETVYYSHPMSRIGGRITRDCTGGYGPEEFLLKQAKPGVYRVEVNYYGSNRQDVSKDVTLTLTLQSDFGMKEQKEQITTLRLDGKARMVHVGKFTVKPTKK